MTSTIKSDPLAIPVPSKTVRTIYYYPDSLTYKHFIETPISYEPFILVTFVAAFAALGLLASIKWRRKDGTLRYRTSVADTLASESLAKYTEAQAKRSLGKILKQLSLPESADEQRRTESFGHSKHSLSVDRRFNSNPSPGKSSGGNPTGTALGCWASVLETSKTSCTYR